MNVGIQGHLESFCSNFGHFKKRTAFFCRLYVLHGWPTIVVFLKQLLEKMVKLQPSALFFLQDLQLNSVPYSTYKGHFWKSVYEWQFKVLWNLSKFSFGIIFVLEHGDLQSCGLVSFTQINLTFLKRKSYQRKDIYKTLSEHFFQVTEAVVFNLSIINGSVTPEFTQWLYISDFVCYINKPLFCCSFYSFCCAFYCVEKQTIPIIIR